MVDLTLHRDFCFLYHSFHSKEKTIEKQYLTLTIQRKQAIPTTS